MYHIDIKKQRERKYITLFDINIMKCIKHDITPGFPNQGLI